MDRERFAIQVPDAVLRDLSYRLNTTRWPDEILDSGWEYGSNLAYMRSLAEYWRDRYDWRREEARLNELPQFRIVLEGFRIHLTHGWPGSFVEMRKLIPLLTDPVGHGGRAEDAFDVIVPSLPGLS